MTSYRYLGNWPNNREAGWTDRLQGVAHNDEHWIFTQMTRIMKFHVGTDLSKADLHNCTSITPIPTHLRDQGYDHFCDPAYVPSDSGNAGYLFVPLEAAGSWWPWDNGRPTALLCVFIDDNGNGPLRFVGSVPIDQKAGWCAVTPSGRTLYTSHTIHRTAPYVRRYSIDWDALRSARMSDVFERKRGLRLTDFDGNPMQFGPYVQGGAFYPDGQLALLAGKVNDPTTNQGIAVFDVKTGNINDRSTQGGSGFRYSFRPSKGAGQEGEGITFWDTTQIPSRHSSLSGQLHAILLNKDIGDDNVWFKHWELDPIPKHPSGRPSAVPDPGPLAIERGAEAHAESENPTPRRDVRGPRVMEPIRHRVNALRRRL